MLRGYTKSQTAIRRQFFVVLLALLPSGAAAETLTAFDLLSFPGVAECPQVNQICYEAIPRFVVAGDADSLLALVNYWEVTCGPGEAVTRTRLLGSVWDGFFDESLFDENIVDYLLEFEDRSRSGSLVQDGQRADFDEFTRVFADQLLPHVPPGSLEKFFCLFYSGNQDQAWRMLRGEDLAGSDLHFYHRMEVRELEKARAVPFFAVGGGVWRPWGKYSFVGDKPLVSLVYGVRPRPWILRLVLNLRPGRTSRPYLVDDSVSGESDRFEALLVAGEVGRTVWVSGRNELNASLGIGVDAIKPFRENDLLLQSIQGSLGAGYQLQLGSDRRYFAALDFRREWTGKRNEQATHIYGNAWSLQLSFGFLLENDPRARLDRLDP